MFRRKVANHIIFGMTFSEKFCNRFLMANF